jgi:hypothetical protein
MQPAALSPRQKNRITSILRQHSLLFGAGIASDDPGVELETAELIASLESPDERQRSRIASILRQHALLFGEGMVLGQDVARKEDDRLIRALRTKGEAPQEAASYAPLTKGMDAWRPSRHGGPQEESLRPYPLNGKGRRTRIAETSGLVVLLYRREGHRGATIVIVPLASVKRRDVQREPVQLWISGEVHMILLEPFGGAVDGHAEWPAFLGREPVREEFLFIRTGNKDRICLGMRPRWIRGVQHVVVSADAGAHAWFFPEDRGAFPGLAGFLKRTFIAGIRIGRSDAEGTAYFAVKRIVGRA